MQQHVVDSKSTNEDFDSLVRIDELNEQLNVETFLFMKRICYIVMYTFYRLISSKSMSKSSRSGGLLSTLSPSKSSGSRNSERATKYFRNPKYFGLQLFQMPL